MHGLCRAGISVQAINFAGLIASNAGFQRVIKQLHARSTFAGSNTLVIDYYAEIAGPNIPGTVDAVKYEIIYIFRLAESRPDRL